MLELINSMVITMSKKKLNQDSIKDYSIHFETYKKNADYFLYHSQYSIETLAKEFDYNIETELLKELITKYSVLAKQLEEKIEEVTRLSITDQLTQIYNRHRLVEELDKYINLYKRYGKIFSISLFDIDHFKSVNDTYGHDIGDVVLKSVSGAVKNKIRNTDVFGRWGGEEFIIILPETALNSAVIAIEQVRALIEGTKEENAPSVTCSFGVVEVNAEDDVDTIVKRVDNLLYEAKEGGRNRVVY